MFSDREILDLYAVTKACYGIQNLTEFREFISTKLRQVFPHESAACCIVETPNNRMLRLINVDFPSEYLHGVIRPNQEIQSPISLWLRQQTPLLVKVDEVNELLVPGWAGLARKNGIQNIASHGLIDIGGNFFSYFAFAGVHPTVLEKYKELLSCIVPHLHIMLVRQLFHSRGLASNNFGSHDHDSNAPLNGVSFLKSTDSQHNLTPRESQVLAWICSGKTNWEISRIVKISENTVKNHVQNIYKKRGEKRRGEEKIRNIKEERREEERREEGYK